MSDAIRGFIEAGASGWAGAGRLAGVRGETVSVLHVFNYFKPDFTGDGIYFEKLFPRLEREGVRNEVIVGRTRPARGVAATPGVRLFGRTSMRQFNPVMLLWFLCNAWRFQVVHIHCVVDRLFAYHLVAAMFGCRVIQSSTLDDGLESVINGYRPAYRPLVRVLCRLIDDFIAISPSLFEESRAMSAAQRVHFIPQGVAIPHADGTTPRTAMRQALGVGASDTLLLFVGGICPRKDARFLVENHPCEDAGVHLMLVGPVLDAGYAAGLREAIGRSPAAGRMHVSGYMADPSPAYRAADVFVFASHKEGCPNVLLEAMAHGLAVIVRDLPGTTDALVTDGRNGVLFRDGAGYKAAVRRLAADAAARQAMGAEAHATVCTTYEMDAMARRYATLYAQG